MENIKIKKLLENFKSRINEISKDQNLKEYHSIIFWFLNTYFGLEENVALASMIDGTRDKGIDAIYINKPEGKVYFIQSKYHKPFGATKISLGDVKIFCSVLDYFSTKSSFKAILNGAKGDTRLKLEEAKKYIEMGFDTVLIYLTTDKMNKEALDFVRSGRGFDEEKFIFFHFNKILDLESEWERGWTPPLGTYDLHFRKNEIFPHNYNVENKITSYVVTVPTSEIQRFSKNIIRDGHDIVKKDVRYFLGGGEKSINNSIKNSLINEPEYFWFYNNGINILCDKVNVNESESKLTLSNPQIINGCQTQEIITRYSEGENSTVLVRIIAFRNISGLMYNIIKAVNNQNPINIVDLRSNDPVQVYLQRQFEIRNYFFQKKRGELSAKCPGFQKKRYHGLIENVKLAKVMIALLGYPVIAKTKNKPLFEDSYYLKIYNKNTPINKYLLAYYLESFIRDSYWRMGKYKKEFDRAFKFKNYAVYHVLTLLAAGFFTVFDHKKLAKIIEYFEKNEDLEDTREILYDIIDDAFDICYSCYIQALRKDASLTPANYFKNKESREVLERKKTKVLQQRLHKFLISLPFESD